MEFKINKIIQLEKEILLVGATKEKEYWNNSIKFEDKINESN